MAMIARTACIKYLDTNALSFSLKVGGGGGQAAKKQKVAFYGRKINEIIAICSL